MAVPKYRPSSQRQGRRRGTHKTKLPDVTKCQFCGAQKRPHFACPNCGKLAKGQKQKAKGKKSQAQKKENDSKKEKK